MDQNNSLQKISIERSLKSLNEDSALLKRGLQDLGIDISLPAKPGYSIGDIGPAGGFIFYINPNYETDGWKYLEAATIDLPGDNNYYRIPWHNGNYVVTGATATAIGTGMSNTHKIVGSQREGNYAAKLCDDLILNGYSDWFLPSKDELDLMYKNLQLKGIGGFEQYYYWSSSEYDEIYAWYQYFASGGQNYYFKDLDLRVRAVRAFY